jgi:hypothetical protein
VRIRDTIAEGFRRVNGEAPGERPPRGLCDGGESAAVWPTDARLMAVAPGRLPRA